MSATAVATAITTPAIIAAIGPRRRRRHMIQRTTRHSGSTVTIATDTVRIVSPMIWSGHAPGGADGEPIDDSEGSDPESPPDIPARAVAAT